MTHTLITFLGRTPKEAGGGYRTTCYDFGDGGDCEPLAFFGWALQRRLRPERLVILGTAGSMWDHLFEGDFDLGDTALEERDALIDKVREQEVAETDLKPLEPLLAEQLGCEVRLRLIPYCRDEIEQVELLRLLADNVASGDRVALDVTHGFRHLPMLALLSALHLQKVRGATISHIYYGALDRSRDGRTPVYELAGLLDIADWLEALSVYGRTGDYGVFDRLLGEEIGGLLRQAAFFETVNRIGQARSLLRQVIKRLEERSGDPVLALFHDELERRISWARQDNYYLRQRQLAREYLERGRYLEAILTGWEAFTTLLQRESGGKLDPDNMAHREEVRQRFEEQQRAISPRTERFRAYDSLRRLRNAVAHGSQPKGEEVQRALSSPEAMRDFLTDLFGRLLPEEAA
ncbi:MAG: TIGR02221 family CRISPR-associated protein [Gammaproteobacteria bacterium]|nr:MAG: TIGR02221 family CRISPR-associated protein [Gammaproteobacteria bacterium]